MKRGDFDEARRLATEHMEPWICVGRDILAGGREIGTMRTAELARYVVAAHKVLLPMMNMLLMALRRAKDVESLGEEE